MNRIKLIVFSSSLHDEASVMGSRRQLLDGIRKFAELELVFPSDLDQNDMEKEISNDGTTEEVVSFIATGGTEEMFRLYADTLPKPVTLLCDGVHNSFAATMEISSFLAGKGIENRVFSAPLDYNEAFFAGFERELFSEGGSQRSCEEAHELVYNEETLQSISGHTIGLFGESSPWLISSGIDRGKVSDRFGVKFIDIPLEELEKEYDLTRASNSEVAGTVERMEQFLSGDRKRIDLENAARMYVAMKTICSRYSLTALTIKCFGILDSCRTTACLALALLNDEGILCACEGDIPALWTMIYAKNVYGGVSFMANPASADRAELTVDFAHCTIPLSMVNGYRLPSHFESSIGIGIAGIVPCGKYRLIKITGSSLERIYYAEGEILMNTNIPQRCRTQLRFRFSNAEDFDRFLVTSKGNHIIISSIL